MDAPFSHRELSPLWTRLAGEGAFVALEILVLGALAASLVLVVFPWAFTIESDCIGAFGQQRITGDSYFAAAAVAGTVGWLGVLLGVIYARISESTRLATLLPLVWFVVFVGGFLVAAAAIGPQVCPS